LKISGARQGAIHFCFISLTGEYRISTRELVFCGRG
jgi:hypothetical protein